MPAGDACAGILADRAAFNSRYDAVRAGLIRSLSGESLTAALALLEATRASGNAQFARLLENCGTPLPTTSTIAPTTTSTLVTTTTTTVPPTDDQCAQLRADRAAFNARISSFQATLSQSLSGAQLAAAVAQLEGTRAQGNAQFASQAAALGCTL
ncbi:MAG TPA: hypothetical protein VGV86_06900 [Acidimicrobiales bacterium]|nr:hypothetical protein [Acidimicrobiales bacterium]